MGDSSILDAGKRQSDPIVAWQRSFHATNTAHAFHMTREELVSALAGLAGDIEMGEVEILPHTADRYVRLCQLMRDAMGIIAGLREDHREK